MQPKTTPSLSAIQPSRNIHTSLDARRLAKRILPATIFDYVDGTAGEGHGESLNAKAILDLRLKPRVLVNVDDRKIDTHLFDTASGTPFGIAPMGMCNLAWPGTDLMFARLSAKYTIPFCVSTMASTALEVLQETAEGNAWFQLYVSGDPQDAFSLVDRVKKAGYNNLIFTVDVPQLARRPRELRRGFKMPFKIGLPQFIDFATHPRWSLTSLANGVPELANFKGAGTGSFDRSKSRGAVDWQFLERLRDHWDGNLTVKGVLDIEDAIRIKQLGADALQVSSHGARQLDSAPPPILQLPKIREAVGASFPIFYDSGLRTGEDIVKAYALGANFVFLGRPFLFASAADRMRGLETLSAILCEETSVILAQLGLRSIDDVSAHVLCTD